MHAQPLQFINKAYAANSQFPPIMTLQVSENDLVSNNSLADRSQLDGPTQDPHDQTSAES
jgi:hypothetical protein